MGSQCESEIARSGLARAIAMVCVAMSGSSGERPLLGQGTTRSIEDVRAATSLALELCGAGLDPSAPILSRGCFLASELPDAFLGRLLDAVTDAVSNRGCLRTG